jgi:hypothetical protein
VKEISTAVVGRRAGENAVNDLRMELSAGSIESQPVPQQAAIRVRRSRHFQSIRFVSFQFESSKKVTGVDET